MSKGNVFIDTTGIDAWNWAQGEDIDVDSLNEDESELVGEWLAAGVNASLKGAKAKLVDLGYAEVIIGDNGTRNLYEAGRNYTFVENDEIDAVIDAALESEFPAEFLASHPFPITR